VWTTDDFSKKLGLRFMVFVLLGLAASLGCGGVDADQLKDWVKEKGGGKKITAVACDKGADNALIVLSVQLLIAGRSDARSEGAEKGVACLGQLPEAKRDAVIGVLAKNLWAKARFSGKKIIPNNVASKDGLFLIRSHARGGNLEYIDKVLLTWYLDNSYQAVSKLGKIKGAQVMQALGAKASKEMIGELNTRFYAPAKNGRYKRIGDELLLGVAATGTTASAKFLLKIVDSDSTENVPNYVKADNTINDRAMINLWSAYAEPEKERGFPAPSPKSLVPLLDDIRTIAEKRRTVGDHAVSLISVTGMPHCVEQFAKLMTVYTTLAASEGLKCGQVAAIIPITQAFKDSGKYEREVLSFKLWGPISKMKPSSEVKAAARKLLTSKNRWARVTGVEIFRGIKKISSQDLELIRALKNDKTPLPGFVERRRRIHIGELVKKVLGEVEAQK